MKIDIGEKFEHLPSAPIVEAVIQIHARPQIAWSEHEVVAWLKPKISGFEKTYSGNNVKHELKIGAANSPEVSAEDIGWHGLVCQSKDQSVQFSRDGFIYSRLQPYQGWDQFLSEAMRWWKTFLELAKPVDIQRVGLRFINKIKLPPKEFNFENYIQPYPEPPFNLDFPFLSFFHHDTLAVPGYPYAINIIRTIQPPANVETDGLGLIVDVDAFTTQPQEIKGGVLEQRLTELRWLKNKAFFGSVTPDAMKLFR